VRKWPIRSDQQRHSRSKVATILKAASAKEHLHELGCLAGEVHKPREEIVNGLIYLVGLIVVIMFILSFLGLH
jgi:hypothetical protein